MRTLCFGEAIVDLICRHPVGSLAEADAFVPSPGGVTANVATAAARHGAVRRAGGRCRRRPVGRVAARPGSPPRASSCAGSAWRRGRATAVAFVTVDERGEPAWQLYGDGVAATVDALDDRLLDAVEATDAFFFTSNTLAGEAEAQLTMAARERALELGPADRLRSQPAPAPLGRQPRPRRQDGGRAACRARSSSSATRPRRG